MRDKKNEFCNICSALDNPVRIDLLRLLVESKTEFPCVIEIAEKLHICLSIASSYLKQMREAGLVSSANADRRVYYRAFPTNDKASKTLATLKDFLAREPSPARLAEFLKVVHALSNRRRLSYLRYLNKNPDARTVDAARELGIPTATLDRMFDQLGHAHLIDVHGAVTSPAREPEDTILALALA